MAKQTDKWGDRREYSTDRRLSRNQQQAAIKFRGLDVFRLNKQGGYQDKMVGRDVKQGRVYILEKRTFWWILVGRKGEVNE